VLLSKEDRNQEVATTVIHRKNTNLFDDENVVWKEKRSSVDEKKDV
jgi:hypothetical protein